MNKIHIENLNKSFGKVEVLRNVSLLCEMGQIISILGPSGCGKTTFIKTLLGIEDFQGSISIDNMPLERYLINNRIAYVPQKYANFDHLTVYKNLELSVRDKKITIQKEEIDKVLKTVGLFRNKDSYPKDLSGGMSQRLAIARALLTNSEIIVFDEPLSALDVETKLRIQELILDIWAMTKKTFIFVTHDIEEAIFLSHKIVVMGSRPGIIREVIDVPYKFPRESSIRFDIEFQKLRKSLSFIIRSESLKATLAREQVIDAVTIGLYFWAGNAPFFYLEDQNLLNGSGLKLELVSFNDNRQKIEYFKQGKIDILNVSDEVALSLQKEIPDLEIIFKTNVSNGADAMVTSKDINSIEELKGQIIGIEKGEVSHFFFKHILNKYGLKEEYFILKDLKGDEMGSMLISGQVDAAVMWEPWLSKAIELSGMKELVSTKNNPFLSDVLVSKKDFIDSNKDLIVKLKEAWNIAVNDYKNKEDYFIEHTAPILGISTSELSKHLKKVYFVI